MLSRILAVSLILVPLVQAGIFPPDSSVKMLEQKTFKKAMQENRTAVVAFVAPWCGHCQKLSPEYVRAADRLKPLVPLYAVDCDAEHNKRLCAEHGVRGFPTLKLFKKGLRSPGIEYQGGRTHNDIYNWAKGAVPNAVKNIATNGVQGISDWQFQNRDKPRALLLNKTNKLPLLWVVLANQFDGKIAMANGRDRRGQTSKAMGFPYNEDHNKPKVILYPAGSKDPVMYEGLLKYDQLSTFLKNFAAGTADLSGLLTAFKEEKDAIPEMEMRKQEAEAIMQGKGYGNPHAGMAVGDDGLPKGDIHEGHGGADYAKAIKDAQDAAARGETPHAPKPIETSEANFDDVDLSSSDEKEMGEDGENYDAKTRATDEL